VTPIGVAREQDMITLKSVITQKILNYFFLNPQSSLYVNELSRKLALDKRNLVKKLRELEEEGILKNDKRGNLKLYCINKEYSLYNEYKRIISKTVGLENELRRILGETEGIKKAYIYGSYAKDSMDTHSDIDLLVIGSHDIMALQRAISKLQKQIDREINIVNMNNREFEKKIKNKNPFLNGILCNKYIEIIP